LPFFGRALGEVGGALPWNQKTDTNPAVTNSSGSLALPPAEPAPAQPASPPTTGALTPPVVTGPTTALGTQDVLATEMADLRAWLAG
jgi:hypothetical protein